jgi:hypothetical protein
VRRGSADKATSFIMATWHRENEKWPENEPSGFQVPMQTCPYNAPVQRLSSSTPALNGTSLLPLSALEIFQWPLIQPGSQFTVRPVWSIDILSDGSLKVSMSTCPPLSRLVMTDYHRPLSDCGPKCSTDGCKSHRPKWQLQQQQQSLAEWPHFHFFKTKLTSPVFQGFH